jgi:uncharacterized protein YndB with AHSA1/START domain
MSVEHATFAIERRYPAAPERVFAAWAQPEAKAAWFGNPEHGSELDFRVGGWERHEGIDPDGNRYAFTAVYHDIVAPERIVYTYEMAVEGRRVSVSLATVELRSDGDGTRLVFTEQGAFFDGLDTSERRAGGMGARLDALVPGS